MIYDLTGLLYVALGLVIAFWSASKADWWKRKELDIHLNMIRSGLQTRACLGLLISAAGILIILCGGG